MVPELGWRSPEASFMIVVLPLPLLPSSPMILPAPTSNETPDSAVFEP
jgi:hypothetical protein